jgi:amino acid transporter
MSVPLNSASLLFGLAALFYPIAYIIRHRNPKISIHVYMIFSFFFMGLSFVFQLMTIQHLVKINDVVAILDTIDVIVFVSWVLIITTVLFNLLALAFSRSRQTQLERFNLDTLTQPTK